MKKLLLSLYLIAATCTLYGQSFIPFKMEEYASHLPLKKVYAHTNKTIFTPNETIFFSAYVSNDNFIISNKSRIIKAELISPAGQIIETKHFNINNLSSKGSFDIKPDAVGGQYKLRISTAWSLNFDNPAYEKEITVLRNIAPRILMQLDIEKEAYGKNDTVRGFLHIRDLNNVDISHLSFEYEVKIDGITFLKKEAKTDNNGKDTISFILPNYIKDQHTSLNVLFNYNLYQESITRNVPIVTDDIDLQFLPEGGFMLTGFANHIAFKAINAEGNPADVKGKIYNDKGDFITSFESFHQGMGKVSLTPQQGEKYYAILSSPYQSSKKIAIPESKTKGFPIQIVEHNKDELIFNILSNQDAAINILIRSEQKIIDNKSITLKKGLNKQVINTTNLPLGVLSICVTAADQIISERLFFNQNQQGLTINISPDKETYRSREKTKLHIKTLNSDGKPIPAIISLSVIDDKLLSYIDDKQHNMLSWMLLGSSIKGSIYEPSFYFDPNQNKRHKAIDMLLLTQGWRNYNWDHILSKDPLLLKQTDTQNVIAGEVKKINNKPFQTTVYILADSLLYTVKTDKNGYFEAQTIPTKEWYVFTAKTRSNDVTYIVPAKLKEGSKYNTIQRKELGIKDGLLNDNYISKEKIEADKKEINTRTYRDEGNRPGRDNFGSDNQQMDEVIVVGYNSLKKQLLTGSATRIISSPLYANPATDVASVLSGKIAGIEVSPSPEYRSDISIRGISSIQSTNGPLIVLDGMPLNEAASFNLGSLNLNSINTITVLRNAEATALYGARGANGVIIIKTNNNRSSENSFNYNIYENNRVIGAYALLASTIFPNSTQQKINQAAEFYYPKYESRKKSLKNDFRDNLYWNYHIETDKDGQATVSYFNADENSLYRIIAEGMTGNGQIGRSQSSTYAVHDDLSLDIKLPLYASQGDIIDLPVWINNNMKHSLDANLKLDLSGGMKLEENDSFIRIPSKDKILKLLPIRVESTYDKTENIRLLLESKDDQIGIMKDIQLFSKGFPIEVGKSTNKSLSHTFEINNTIGIQELKINLYLSPIQQITDGLTRIVREPYGCFEQVSSSVYPNIYALQLLRQTGSNRDLEQKTVEYLKNGYTKLVAYEVKGAGFDWFGRPPAHEVLSAFGLIEFIEMKPYMDVNSSMLERTKKWLLSKKDNKGGYHQGAGKYAFSGNRKTINNTYITYALSMAGCSTEIEKEYLVAKEEALLSQDLYRLSLVALTAKELKKEEDYNLISSLLKVKLPSLITSKSNIQKLVEGSITQSYGKSLYNETLALMAIVLAQEENPSEELTRTINELITNSNAGYFGSTQATGLSLKAISMYYLLLKNKIKTSNPQISFKIDGEEYLKDSIKGNESLSWRFFPNLKPGKHRVEMSLEGLDLGILSFTYKYKTTLPPNSAERSLDMHSSLSHDRVKVGDNTLLKVKVKNKKSEALPMSIAKIGLPGGASPEPKQLRDLQESGMIDFYEIFNNYLVLYWREIGPNEEKNIAIELKAQVPGDYTGAASSTYLYYTEELKHWNEGLQLRITP